MRSISVMQGRSPEVNKNKGRTGGCNSKKAVKRGCGESENGVKLAEQLQKECEKGSWVPAKDMRGSPLRYEKHRGVSCLDLCLVRIGRII